MDNNENVNTYEEVVSALNEMIELQQETNEHLTTETAYQQEIINGLTLVVNYQFALIGIIVIGAVIAFSWNIFNKWFFRGV